MKKFITLFSISALMALFSCTVPSGADVTKHFDVPGTYTKLVVSDGMVVTVSDAVDDIVITGDENIMEKVVVKLTYGTLRIYRKDLSVAYLTKMEVQLPFESKLCEVEVGTASEFHTAYGIEGTSASVKVDEHSKFEGYVLADKLDVKVTDNSSADLSFDLHNRMTAEISESSTVKFNGYVPNVSLKMTDNALIDVLWDGDLLAFQCDYVYGSMQDNCKAYIDCESEIAMALTNGCVLCYTSWPYLGNSTCDETSSIVNGN